MTGALVSAAAIVGVGSGFALGAGQADAQVDQGTYQYCNHSISGHHVPLPHCSDVVVRGDRIFMAPNQPYRITPTRDGGFFTVGGTRFVLRKSPQGYYGTMPGGAGTTTYFTLIKKR